ncbi:MAG TPA: amidohydrolase family protein [Gemmatimonas sp.]|nr:amidohydrolase family protein [Gemmatimonas sp.]
MNLVEQARIVPIAAHHQHMVAPAFLSVWHPGPMKGATLPPALDSLMRAHRALIGVPVVTADSARSVYAADARLVLFTGVVSGPPAIARHWRSYRNEGWTRHVLPTGYTLRDSSGHIFGVMVETRPDSSTRYARRLMNVLVTVAKGTDGRWRIVAETGTPIENSVNVDTITAASLVAHLDEAGITHGVVAGLGYEFADGPETPGERERLQAENDWTVKQVAQFPGRLTVFCGMNPIRSYAIAEMDRCSKMPSVRGMKLYIHNRVDLTNPDHVQKLRAYVRAANERRLPLLVHLSIDVNDGARHARTFLEEVVPEAPDIPIQIAHMGSGGTYRLTAPDQALKVFADAAAARSPLMKNLYFDFTGSIYGTQTAASLDTLAHRMRTIGLTRILFGSDLPLFPLEPPGPAWARFRRLIPLTNDELRIIARNVMPYAR